MFIERLCTSDTKHHCPPKPFEIPSDNFLEKANGIFFGNLKNNSEIPQSAYALRITD